MHKCADPFLIARVGSEATSIFSSAEARACGLSVNNILDVVPEWKFEALNPAGGTLLADPAMVKVQSNLITFNQRYAVMTNDGYHFSQLGRLFNATLRYAL